MQRNLESKFAAHKTEQLELWGGQVGLEKDAKKAWEPVLSFVEAQ